MCTFRNSFKGFAIDTLVGQDAHSVKFYGQNTTVGVLLHATRCFDLMFCATRPFLFLMYK